MTKGGHMAQRFWCAAVVVLAVVLRAAAACGQPCEDQNQCTVDDVCVDEVCQGTPTLGADCDVGVEGIINGHCIASAATAACRGERAPAGTPCQQGCVTLHLTLVDCVLLPPFQ